MVSDNDKIRDPWATTLTWVNCCELIRSFTHHFYQPVKYQGNGLNSFWGILLTRLKCWNFQRAIFSLKRGIRGTFLRNHFEIRPLAKEVMLFNVFFVCFFLFLTGGNFIQRRGTILTILVKGHKRNTSVKLLLNQATCHEGESFKGFFLF